MVLGWSEYVGAWVLLIFCLESFPVSEIESNRVWLPSKFISEDQIDRIIGEIDKLDKQLVTFDCSLSITRIALLIWLNIIDKLCEGNLAGKDLLLDSHAAVLLL